MNSAQAADQEARRLIREQLDINLFVEAGAGSGKTSSLVARVVALVASGQVRLAEIAVVTFTRKAAAELKERLQLELEAASRITEGELKARLKAAADDLNCCFIGTIHAFCASLLRERPVEAGLSPDFTEIEGVEEQILELRAWNEYLQMAPAASIEALSRVGINPSQLYDAFQRLNTYPEVDFPGPYSPRPDFDHARSKLDEIIKMAASCLPDREPDKGWDTLQSKLRRALRWQLNFNLQDELVLADLLEKLEGSAAITQNRWSSKETAIATRDAFTAFQQEVVEPTLDSWRKHRYQPIMEFLRPAVAYAQQKRAQENCLNFQDLLLRASALLKQYPTVRDYFQRRYRRLLVDEFQDTDPLQAEIMVYLSGDDVNEQDWTSIRPHPGSLFVVGDPKQSIYRFRRADIDTFYQVQQQIKAAGGETLSLTRNFRSLPVVVDWVNTAFTDLFAESAPPRQAEYRAMVAEREEVAGTLSGLKLVNLDKEAGNSAEKIAFQDAKKVAAYISQALTEAMPLLTAQGEKRPAEPKDFMILVQVKKQLALYARELEALGIPYIISGQNQIGNCLPLWELFYLAEAVADPGNPVLLAAVWRGLFYGFSDQDLFGFKQAGGEFNYLSPLPTELERELQQKFFSVCQQFATFREYARKLPPVAAFELMAQEVGLLPLLISQGGKSAAANYYLLIECLQQAQDNGLARFDQLVTLMGQFLESGIEEELDLTYGQAKGVRIMNLHKAKGLEASVVFLADPGSRPGEGIDLYVQREGTISTGWLEVTKRIGDFSRQILAYPSGWRELQAEEALYQEAERVRLLYVAATRARDMLVVSNYADKPQKSPWVNLLPYLEANTVVADLTAVEVDKYTAAANELPAADFIPHQERRLQRYLQIQVASSRVATVTGTVHQAISSVPGTGRGRGPAWGNAVHRALECLAAQPNLLRDINWLTGILQTNECDSNDLPVFQELLTGVMHLEFWQRIQRAQVVLTEVPFGIWENDTYLKGTIDLVIREEHGWVIADYKSDAVEDEAALQILTEHYRPQVALYADSWQRLTGEKVIEMGILFTDCLQWMPLSVGD